MAHSKFADARYRLINRELKKKDWVKTSELKRKIESELGHTISLRQIEKDMNNMQNDVFLNFDAPIKYDKSNKAYQYTDRSFSIEKFNLREDEILALKFHAASLNQYRDSGIFKDFSNALQKVVEAVSIKSQLDAGTNSRLIVQTDNVVTSKGSQYLTVIAQAIEGRKKIEFHYKKFGDLESKNRLFLPYLLKEYKNRWYLIGKLDNGEHVLTFALDRITGLKNTSDNFIIDSSFDHNKYFKYSFGITKPEKPPVKITLLFTPQQGNYIKSLPIHHSQKIISEDKKGLKVCIETIPSYELFEYIVGQGTAVKVVSPKRFANDVKAIHQAAFKQYNK